MDIGKERPPIIVEPLQDPFEPGETPAPQPEPVRTRATTYEGER